MLHCLVINKGEFWKVSSGGSCFLNGMGVVCIQIFCICSFLQGFFLFWSCVPAVNSGTPGLLNLIITILPDNLMDAAQQKSLGFIGRCVLTFVVQLLWKREGMPQTLPRVLSGDIYSVTLGPHILNTSCRIRVGCTHDSILSLFPASEWHYGTVL